MIATSRPIQTRFRYGSDYTCLSLATTNNSLTHSSIGTRSPHIAAKLPLICKLKISESISLPFLGFFSPFPHGTIRYRCKKVFSLTQWSGRIHTGFLVSDTTQVSLRRYIYFKYGTVTLYGASFQKLLLYMYFITPRIFNSRSRMILQHLYQQRL